jgi:hypothetical protein
VGFLVDVSVDLHRGRDVGTPEDHLSVAGRHVQLLEQRRGILAALAPVSLILPAFVAVGINERSLNSVFASYGITRKPQLWPRQHRI